MRTFSAVYCEWFKLDEKRYLDEVKRSANSHSPFIYPTMELLNENLDNFINHQEETVISFSQLTQYLVMKLAHENELKVLLDGQGADELLVGYDYMTGYYLNQQLRSLNLKSFFEELLTVIKRKNVEGLQLLSYHFSPNFLRKKILYRNKKYLSNRLNNIISQDNFYLSPMYKSKSLTTALIVNVDYKLEKLLR